MTMPPRGPSLLLGPLLRYVDDRRAHVWVETDRACEVGVLDATARTFCVHGHHYALVRVDGLEPGSTTPYTVTLDGAQVWPVPGSAYPPSTIRTYQPGRPLRVVFGSCRTSVPHTDAERRTHGVDVLRAFGHRMAAQPTEQWPDVVLLIGDQVYADETSEEMQQFIRSRRDIEAPPGAEVADFEEYTRLYQLAWSDDSLRWLMSTLPSAMIFDDHDIRDDWNTSDAWRREMAAQPWWRRRITGGLGSYWLYQHLGNLTAEDVTDDPLLKVLEKADGDAGEALDDFAWTADQDPTRNRWSYARQYGGVRLVVVDSRCGRMLHDKRRTIVDDGEWEWLEQQLQGDVDHLLIGTSLPYLLPFGIHHVEGWNEAVCRGAWGRRMVRLGERIRQGVDLEHWAAFRRSFDAMARAIAEVATGKRGRAPSTIVFLSGDVHYSYLARASVPGGDAPGKSRIYQAVCSPIRNPLSPWMRFVNVAAQFGLSRLVGRGLAAAAGVRDPALRWKISEGPMFANMLGTVTVNGPRARVVWEKAVYDGEHDDVVDEGAVELTAG